MSDPIDELPAFIDACPSPYHAAEKAANLLESRGWRRLAPDDPLSPEPGGYLTVRGGNLLAWYLPPTARPDTPFIVVGAHTDSPNLRITPRPERSRAGWRQLAVEVYGGALLNSWLDRDLGLSGRVVVEDPTRTRLVRVDTPVLRVAQLAIHLDREVNDGLTLDRHQHLSPIWGLGDGHPGEFTRFVADQLDVEPERVVSWDLMVHDLTPSRYLGVDGEFLAAPRLDNLASCWAGTAALSQAAPHSDTISVLALFDHEEVGSQTATGAAAPELGALRERLVHALGGGVEELHRGRPGSLVVSADMAHAVHPNYLDRHEPNHHVVPNAGPVIKLNANARYASDAETTARFRQACERVGVPVQTYVHRQNLACGSTIGPITAAALGVPVVDVGMAQLSMHSARELCGAHDPELMVTALAEIYRDPGLG